MSASLFAGDMAEAQSPDEHRNTYVFINGGYYKGLYQTNFTRYSRGVLTSLESFDDPHSDGYGQLGLGRAASIGWFAFDHQLSVGRLFGTRSFRAGTSNFNFKQEIDFGYDFMPKISVFQSLIAYGIVGAHYGRFTYQKIPSLTTATYFHSNNNELGFNLGAGVNYEFNTCFSLGIQYQHWQYGSTQVFALNTLSERNEIQRFEPSFDLVGVNLRYYWPS